MKLTKKMRCAMIICVLGLTLGSHFSAYGQIIDPTTPRAWRAYGGHSFTASFVELKGDVVVLKGEDGSTPKVPLHMLVPEDQALAKELGAQIAAGGAFAVKPGSGNRLAEFVDGPAKGNFALYENEKFVVRIAPNARIVIQCLEDGKPVGKPIEVLMGHIFQDLKTRNPVRRSIVSFAEAYHPVLQPDVVNLEGFLGDKIPFGFTIAFEGQSIHLAGWVEDPTPGSPGDYTPAFKFARSHSFEAHVLVTDQKIALKPFSLEINPLKGKAFTQPYGERLQGGDVALRTIAIKGAVFGSRRLGLAVGPSRAAEMHISLRSDNPIFNGFQVCLQKRTPELRDPSCRITLTID